MGIMLLGLMDRGVIRLKRDSERLYIVAVLIYFVEDLNRPYQVKDGLVTSSFIVDLMRITI